MGVIMRNFINGVLCECGIKPLGFLVCLLEIVVHYVIDLGVRNVIHVFCYRTVM